MVVASIQNNIFGGTKFSPRAFKQPRASGRATKRLPISTGGQKIISRRPDPFAPLAVTTDGGKFSTETSTSGFA